MLAVMVGLLVLILCIPSLRKHIKIMDAFTDKHNYENDKEMTIRMTTIGGLFTLLLLYGALIVIMAEVLYFKEDLEEEKSFLPVLSEDTYDDSSNDILRGNLKIKVTFSEYGGNCISQEDECVPEIQVTPTDIDGEFSSP